MEDTVPNNMPPPLPTSEGAFDDASEIKADSNPHPMGHTADAASTHVMHQSGPAVPPPPPPPTEPPSEIKPPQASHVASDPPPDIAPLKVPSVPPPTSPSAAVASSPVHNTTPEMPEKHDVHSPKELPIELNEPEDKLHAPTVTLDHMGSSPGVQPGVQIEPKPPLELHAEPKPLAPTAQHEPKVPVAPPAPPPMADPPAAPIVSPPPAPIAPLPPPPSPTADATGAIDLSVLPHSGGEAAKKDSVVQPSSPAEHHASSGLHIGLVIVVVIAILAFMFGVMLYLSSKCIGPDLGNIFPSFSCSVSSHVTPVNDQGLEPVTPTSTP